MTPPAATATVMLERLLEFGDDSYPFTLAAGPGAWDDLTSRLAALGTRHFVLVTDPGVPAGLPDSVLVERLRLDSRQDYRPVPPGHLDMVLLEAPGRACHWGAWPLP